MSYLKRHLSIILILLLAMLAIALVWWLFDWRLRQLDDKKLTKSTLDMRFISSKGRLVNPFIHLNNNLT